MVLQNQSNDQNKGMDWVKMTEATPMNQDLDYIKEYRDKTTTSARIFARSSRLHINGVSHNIRYFDPYPFVVRSSAGKSLVDVDSNTYTDYWMGHWSMILGHGHERVRSALENQIHGGWMYGTVNEQTILLSEMLVREVPVAEKIRYVTSGTEATMYAARLARSATGKKVIAKIDGGWHGYGTDLLKTVNWPFSGSESSGLVGAGRIVSIPYNDLQGSLAILARHSSDLAGVIIEPVLGGGGCIPAKPDYLRGIQEFCKSNGIMFMLDEIVTGFRFGFGCMYTSMGLDPDIVTLGKIIGGGMPIGAICGKDEVMNMANTTNRKKSERSYVGGGTFSAHPAAMTAGHTTLTLLKARAGTIYPKIAQLGQYAREQLGNALADENAIVTGTGSLFMTHFAANGITEINSSADAARCDVAKLVRYHFTMIAHNGIFFLPGKLGAISAAHTKRDIAEMVKASCKFVDHT